MSANLLPVLIPADEAARVEALERAETARQYAELLDCEPPCSCIQTDVDLFDARGCELHDPASAWNEALRAVTPVQAYEHYTGPVSEPFDLPEVPF